MQDNYDPLAAPAGAWEGNQFDRELPSIGEHQAVCSQVHNIGYQDFKGEVSASPRILFIFELDEKLKEGKLKGQSMQIAKEFNYFMGEGSALRTFLENWRKSPYTPEEIPGFTLRKVIGKGCTLLINHKKKQNGDPRAEIVGISAPKGQTPPVTMQDVPEWVQKKIAGQVKMQKVTQAAVGAAGAPPSSAGAPPAEEYLPF